MTVDTYLAGAPEPQRTTLETLRTTLRSILPAAEEGLSYGVPAFKVSGRPVAGFAYFKRHCSYFPHSGSVLEGLLAFEAATGGTPASREGRRSGEAYLLKRHLFRRLSTGEPADDRFLRAIHPDRWFYSVLRGLEHFRRSSELIGIGPDPRLAEAIDHIRRERRDDGRWNLDWRPEGRTWFDLDDGPGEPSRWITLRALRVLAWWDAQDPST